MKKSVFVIDTPEHGCISCLIGRNHSDRVNVCIYCPITEKFAWNEEAETIPDWCLLRTLPEKISLEKPEEYYYGKMHGWNACIDKIAGGDDGKDDGKYM